MPLGERDGVAEQRRAQRALGERQRLALGEHERRPEAEPVEVLTGVELDVRDPRREPEVAARAVRDLSAR